MTQSTSVRIYSTEDLSLLYELDSPTGEFIGHATYSPDGSQIAMTDWADITYILDAETGDVVREFDSAIETVNFFAWLSDDTMVQSDMGRILVLLDAETGEELASYEFEFLLREIVVREDYLLVSNGDNEVLLWHPATDDIIETYAFETSRGAWHLAIDETLIMANEDRFVFATEYTLPEDE